MLNINYPLILLITFNKWFKKWKYVYFNNLYYNNVLSMIWFIILNNKYDSLINLKLKLRLRILIIDWIKANKN